MSWRGQPLSYCRRFWITEFGVGGRLNNPSDPARAESVFTEYVTYEFGPMFNLDNNSALGVTVSAKLMHETHLGLFGRYRRWLNDRWAFDVSPGALVYGDSHEVSYQLQYPTAAGRVGLSYGDWWGITGGFEVTRIRDADSELDWFADARLGYFPGAAAGLLFLALAVAVASSTAVP